MTDWEPGAGEHYTAHPFTVGDVLWTDRRPKVFQRRLDTHLSNTLTWQVNPDLQAKILQALSKTAKPGDVKEYLHGLRLIGRDALTAGLKDVLSPQRPEVKAVLQGGKDDETIKSAFLPPSSFPERLLRTIWRRLWEMPILNCVRVSHPGWAGPEQTSPRPWHYCTRCWTGKMRRPAHRTTMP